MYKIHKDKSNKIVVIKSKDADKFDQYNCSKEIEQSLLRIPTRRPFVASDHISQADAQNDLLLDEMFSKNIRSTYVTCSGD